MLDEPDRPFTRIVSLNEIWSEPHGGIYASPWEACTRFEHDRLGAFQRQACPARPNSKRQTKWNRISGLLRFKKTGLL